MLGFYFSPFCRISRKDFWLKYILVLVGLSIAAIIVDMVVFAGVRVTQDTGPVEGVVNVAILWPQVALTTKRFHDRGMSGWWQLLFNIAIAAGGVFAYSALLEAGVERGLPIPDNLYPPLLIGGGMLVVFGFAELVILGFLPGTKGANKYGDDPLSSGESAAEVFS